MALTAAAAGPLEDGQSASERGDYAMAMQLWRPLAAHGNPTAQYYVGLLYADGRGVPRDYRAALLWYRKAAEQGNPEAQDALGDMYYLAVGVPQDYAQAANWYRQAAARGYGPAQVSLGILYEQGWGVPLDLIQAYMWFSLAAAGERARGLDDHETARFGQAVAAKMTAAQIAEAERLADGWRPANGAQ
jgi:TPR repeat protein